MKLTKTVVASLVAASALGLHASSALAVDANMTKSEIGEVYAFGDSLSDGGAMVKILSTVCSDSVIGALQCGGTKSSVSMSDKYYNKDHFTNGPTAFEVMLSLMKKKSVAAAKLDKIDVGVFSFPLAKPLDMVGNNYAIAGATAATQKNIPRSLIDLESQVNAFLAQHTSAADTTDVFVIMIGAVDIFAALSDADIDAAVSGVKQALERLKTYGARNFYLVKYPDFSRLPKYATASDADKAKLRKYIERFNNGIEALKKSVVSENSEHVKLRVFDLGKPFDFMRQHAYGIQTVNINSACLNTPPLDDVIKSFQSSHGSTITMDATFNQSGGCKNSADMENWLFHDDIHPSKLGHQYLGQAFYDFVMESRTGTCAVHSLGAEWPEKKVALPGSIYLDKGRYFRLMKPALSDRKYGPTSTTGADAAHWENLGQTLDGQLCATPWRAKINDWDARQVLYGVKKGYFEKANKGDLFSVVNTWLSDGPQAEYWQFLDANGNGAYSNFPTDKKSNPWWKYMGRHITKDD